MAGSHVGMEVQKLAESHDGGGIHVTLTLQFWVKLTCGIILWFRGDGPEQCTIGVPEGLHGPFRQGISFGLPELPPDVSINVLSIELQSVEDEFCSFHHIVSDPVPGKPGDPVLCHFVPSVVPIVPIPPVLNTNVRGKDAGEFMRWMERVPIILFPDGPDHIRYIVGRGGPDQQ